MPSSASRRTRRSSRRRSSSGDAYDDDLKAAAREDRRRDRDLLLARAPGHPRRLRRPASRPTTRRTESTATSRWKSSRASRTTPSKTFEQVQWIAKEVDRPNLYVKIPATEPGLPAIEDSIAHGTSINITLIFSLERYKAVVEAYLRGLERLIAHGGDPSKVVSVASFFVSRVDTEADKQLEAAGHPELAGKLAIANAKLAYQHYLEAFSGARWDVPRGQGRAQAALPLGLDVDEEPRLPRRDVRRGADRPRDGQHDAARDDRGVPGSRRGARRHRARGRRRGARRCSSSSPRPASTTPT